MPAEDLAVGIDALGLEHVDGPGTVVAVGPQVPGFGYVSDAARAVPESRDLDDEVHGFANDFRALFGLYPNILRASPATFARLDMAAEKANIRGVNGERAEGHTPLSDFVASGYSLMFVVGEELAVGAVVLLWDGDPDGGGEVPDEDTPVSEADGGAKRIRGVA